MPAFIQIITGELEALCRATSSDFSALSFAPNHEPRIRWKYAFGNRSERYKQMVVKPGLGPGGLTLRTGKTTRWTDFPAARPGLPMECPLVASELLHAAAAVPITMRETVYGVLLIARRSAEAYADSDIDTLYQHVQTLQSLLEPTL
ncbi:GAF domain-containing protein [Paenibacillus sp. tmac-D7]|uniref:GAF domain-containing protein n=1 Tax=Paenibacillus sp. tmac-D7 TaxID=2591462 RepID=UPI00114248D8|nr:GAF domain-containing protein [Paenibacillus sp. tmac-D7]